MSLGFAFPNHQYSPAKTLQRASLAGITSHIAFQLRPPVLDSRFRKAIARRAVVLMPKTAVDQNHSAKTGKHQIGTTRQIAHMQPVPVSEPMNERTDDPFRSRVFAAHARHQLASFRGR